MRYSKEVLQLAFLKTWDKLSNDEILLRFFNNSQKVFLDNFTHTTRQDDAKNFYREDDEGYHKNVIFHHLFGRIAKNLHPNHPQRGLSEKECLAVFAAFENRPTRVDDLKESLQKEEYKFRETMKSISENDQMYGYLYYHLYKGMIEELVENRIEIKDEILFKRIKDSKLSISQSCIVLRCLKVDSANHLETTVLCGFSSNSVKTFRDFYTSFQNDEKNIYDHGRNTGKDFIRVLRFLNDFEYDTLQFNKFYERFKKAVQS